MIFIINGIWGLISLQEELTILLQTLFIEAVG